MTLCARDNKMSGVGSLPQLPILLGFNSQKEETLGWRNAAEDKMVKQTEDKSQSTTRLKQYNYVPQNCLESSQMKGSF